MEEWAFVDEGELLSFRGSEACMTCQHFTHGVDAHCHTLLACRLRQQRLADGEHLTRRCRLWTPTWHQEAGWAPEFNG